MATSSRETLLGLIAELKGKFTQSRGTIVTVLHQVAEQTKETVDAIKTTIIRASINAAGRIFSATSKT